ncbi:MAG: Glutamate-tRNA ligase [candidate division TM6 bacterium GW2011_GWF2_30_66]|jgi:nondiscriminating glutamyl-tRNA synthetase|nr:MAG: Glutamate-tRNA ligase [candidate division TM6 bacterium GW2011_GWF2_30_66]
MENEIVTNKKIRVRFAPSPTGMMHLGNVRTALLNYLFAKQKNGTFVLRIEDTDPERNFDPGAVKIMEDLNWLGLTYDEGPNKPGSFPPYFQAQRTEIYQENLQQLISENKVYRCFCSQEELENKKQRQIALKIAPRYDKTCCKLTPEQIKEKLDKNIPFIWRMKLDPNTKITITDISHGQITFDMKNFSDFPITRQTGTFTFMFSNFVDDMVMDITHVIRGEDHLSNTAGQAALFKAFEKELPTYWHLPMICNIEGKKLSKRDFGFSIRDLQEAGYLPEALCNYLSIMGGSFEQEIMTISELLSVLDFSKSQAKGQIKYDLNKLNWINHKWISNYDNKKLTNLCKVYIEKEFPQAKALEKNIGENKLIRIIEILKPGLTTLKDITQEIRFLFVAPETTKIEILSLSNVDQNSFSQIIKLLEQNLSLLSAPEEFLNKIKLESKTNNFKIKDVFSLLRIGLIGSTKGPGIGELIDILGSKESKNRLEKLINIAK